MPIVGVLPLPSVVSPASSSQTPATTILSHLSDIYPTQSQQPFYLEHRLFVSTSSMLPNTDNKRTYTHLFTSYHAPQKTYIGTTSISQSTDPSTKNSDNGITTISVPSSTSLEPFTSLITQKLQPQWAARQFLVLDHGGSFTLPIIDDGTWKIGVGDLRLAPSKISGNAAGQLRGAVIELHYDSPDASAGDFNKEAKKRYETVFRSLLKSLFRNLKLELKLDEVTLHIARVNGSVDADTDGSKNSNEDKQQQQQHDMRRSKPVGHEIAELYMEALRGSR